MNRAGLRRLHALRNGGHRLLLGLLAPRSLRVLPQCAEGLLHIRAQLRLPGASEQSEEGIL